MGSLGNQHGEARNAKKVCICEQSVSEKGGKVEPK